MNSIHNVYYTDGEAMPVASKAQHLGTSMDARVNPHVEINARITNTRIVLSKLDIFWKRAPVSITWRLRVHDSRRGDCEQTPPWIGVRELNASRIRKT